MRRHACLLVLALLGIPGCYVFYLAAPTPEQKLAEERESRWPFIESIHGRVFRLEHPAVLRQWPRRTAELAAFGAGELLPRSLEDFEADRGTWERFGVTLVEKGTEVIPEELAFESLHRDGGNYLDLSIKGTFVRVYGRVRNGEHLGKRVELLGLIEVELWIEKRITSLDLLRTRWVTSDRASYHPLGYRVRPGLLTLVE
jgi:hypothetical protein